MKRLRALNMVDIDAEVSFFLSFFLELDIVWKSR